MCYITIICSKWQAVSLEEGESLAKEYNMPFFECSAKQDIGVEKAFLTLATAVKERLMVDGGTAGRPGGTNGGQKLAAAKANEAKSGGCC